MFIGHFAVGFASKRLAPRTSLGLLIAAPLFLDMLWPIFLLAGVEHVRVDPAQTPFLRLVLYDMPWSHSLAMSLLWSVLFGGGYWLLTRDRAAGLVLAAGVLSHWVLDFVTHSPDMPLYPGGPKVGLGLWSSTAATIVVESILFIGAVGLYLSFTRARDRIGSIACWAFIGLNVLTYVSSILAPPPAEQTAIALGALSIWIFLLWVHWFDRHRDVRAASQARAG